MTNHQDNVDQADAIIREARAYVAARTAAKRSGIPFTDAPVGTIMSVVRTARIIRHRP